MRNKLTKQNLEHENEKLNWKQEKKKQTRKTNQELRTRIKKGETQHGDGMTRQQTEGKHRA